MSDAELAHLQTLKTTLQVAIDNTPVTDAGLLHLKGLTRLNSLSLKDTSVTDAGVAELERAMPQLKVER